MGTLAVRDAPSGVGPRVGVAVGEGVALAVGAALDATVGRGVSVAVADGWAVGIAVGSGVTVSAHVAGAAGVWLGAAPIGAAVGRPTARADDPPTNSRGAHPASASPIRMTSGQRPICHRDRLCCCIIVFNPGIARQRAARQ